jgi:hypothetical protein
MIISGSKIVPIIPTVLRYKPAFLTTDRSETANMAMIVNKATETAGGVLNSTSRRVGGREQQVWADLPLQ